MSKSSRNSRNQQSQIQCVEVMIPQDFIERSSHNLSWTLSVYSLENQPVQTSPAGHSVVFHFMLYDWQRTIKQLLESQQVPFFVLQNFATPAIHQDALSAAAAQLASAESRLVEVLGKHGHGPEGNSAEELDKEALALEH